MRVQAKTERLKFVSHELDRKMRNEDREIRTIEKNINHFEKDIEYVS